MFEPKTSNGSASSEAELEVGKSKFLDAFHCIGACVAHTHGRDLRHVLSIRESAPPCLELERLMLAVRSICLWSSTSFLGRYTSKRGYEYKPPETRWIWWIDLLISPNAQNPRRQRCCCEVSKPQALLEAPPEAPPEETPEVETPRSEAADLLVLWREP